MGQIKISTLVFFGIALIALAAVGLKTTNNVCYSFAFLVVGGTGLMMLALGVVAHVILNVTLRGIK